MWLLPGLRLLAAHRFELDHFNKPSAIKENQRKTSTETRRNTTHATDATRHTQQTQANEMHVRYRKQKQATKTKARSDTGKQEQANNTDIGYGQTRHEQRGAAARAAAIGQPQLQFKFIGNADHGGMIIGRRDGL